MFAIAEPAGASHLYGPSKCRPQETFRIQLEMLRRIRLPTHSSFLSSASHKLRRPEGKAALISTGRIKPFEESRNEEFSLKSSILIRTRRPSKDLGEYFQGSLFLLFILYVFGVPPL